MPNSRRRRFSVHNGIGGKGPCKMQNKLQSSCTEPDAEINSMAHYNSLMSKSKNKIQATSSRNSNRLEIIADCSCESTTSLSTVRKLSTGVIAVDKDTTASSSNIDLFNSVQTTQAVTEPSLKSAEKGEGPKRTRPNTRDTTPLHRDKYPRQHRIKVRSPKRRIQMPDIPATKNFDMLRCTVATAPIDWDQEVEVSVDNSANIEAIEDERQSEHSLDDMCRICHGGDVLSLELGQLISACSCRGTVGRVHVKCLERWLTESGKSRCELCGTRYATRRVHRYGVPRALVMWILSQNAKQLMVDSLGIMLMSPLAVLAAWLSGRTLAGLMTQDSHAAPWPLASTFVLACMTLVCYYCWIVSAATRHALGWWVWYRSQYEVRLTMLNDD